MKVTSQTEKIKRKIALQLSRVKKQLVKDRSFTGYRDRLYSANFDSEQFILSCYEGQQAFKRMSDKKLAMELITYVIARIKDAMRSVEQEDAIPEKD